MLKVVLDTNVLIDAWQDNFSYTRRIIDEVMMGNLEAVASHQIWREYSLILDRLVKNQEHYRLANDLFSMIQIVEPRVKVNIVKYDKEDNKFFEAAIEAKADYIISNDSHLWEIGEYRGVKVAKPENFWFIYKEKNDDSGKEEWKSLMGSIMGNK